MVGHTELPVLSNEHVIGYVRAITDELSNGYICMLVIDPEYQRQGIGQALIQAVIHTAPNATWVLRAGREGSANFFEKLGFQMSTIAMERNRKG